MGQPFTAFSSHLIQASSLGAITPGVAVHAATSSPINNSTGTTYNSFKLNVEYSGLSPTGVTSWTLGCVVEVVDSVGDWTPIHYQFSSVNGLSKALKRILILQPDMDTFNLGIDDIVFPANVEEARISRSQGSLPSTQFRVCILLVDNDPTGPNKFVQATVTARGELYNV